MRLPDRREPLFLDRTGTWRDLDRVPRAFIGVPVVEQAFQPIEAAVLGWFAGFAGRVARGETPAPEARPEPRPASEPAAAAAVA